MVWCFRTHTWTPPFHHHLAAPVAGRLLLSWQPLPMSGGVGGGSRGSLSGCPREGLGLQRLPSYKLEAQTQDFPEKVLAGAPAWVGAKPSGSPGERGLSGFIEAGRGTQEKVFLLLLCFELFPDPRVQDEELSCGTT